MNKSQWILIRFMIIGLTVSHNVADRIIETMLWFVALHFSCSLFPPSIHFLLGLCVIWCRTSNREHTNQFHINVIDIKWMPLHHSTPFIMKQFPCRQRTKNAWIISDEEIFINFYPVFLSYNVFFLLSLSLSLSLAAHFAFYFLLITTFSLYSFDSKDFYY